MHGDAILRKDCIKIVLSPLYIVFSHYVGAK